MTWQWTPSDSQGSWMGVLDRYPGDVSVKSCTDKQKWIKSSSHKQRPKKILEMTYSVLVGPFRGKTNWVSWLIPGITVDVLGKTIYSIILGSRPWITKVSRVNMSSSPLRYSCTQWSPNRILTNGILLIF